MPAAAPEAAKPPGAPTPRKWPNLTLDEEAELQGYLDQEAAGTTLSHSEMLRKTYLLQLGGGEMPWPFGVFLDAMRGLVTWVKEQLFDPLIRLIASLLDQVGAAIASAMGVTLTAITSMVHPSSPLSPEMALPMFSVVAASMLAIQTTFIGANALHPIKELIGDTANAMICKFLGFEELSSAFWSSLGGEVLDHPMRLWARMTFRARVPDHRLADEMYWHGVIGGDEWQRLHTYEGWPDETIAQHARSQWREPTPRELGMITDAVGIPQAQIEEILRHRGTEPALAQTLAAAIARRPLADELKQLRSQLISSCVDGLMTEGELESALRGLGVTDGEISLIRQIVALRVSRAQATQVVKDMTAYQTEARKAATMAYERDLMDDGQYLEELLSAGLSSLRAAQMLYIEQLRKTPRPRRTAAHA